MRYLLDELNAHENDHSDALAPEQPPAGEAALAQPAMMETAHDAALAADVRVLQATVNRISTSMDKVSASQMAMSDDVRSLREQLGNMANHSLSNYVCPGTWCPSNPSGPPSVQSGNGTPLPSKSNGCHNPIHHPTAVPQPFSFAPPPSADTPNRAQPPSFHPNPATNHDHPSLLSSQAGQHSAPLPPPPPSLPLSWLVSTGPNGVATLNTTPPHMRNGRAARAAMPETGLRIPNVPIPLEDGVTMSPKSESWRVIMSHWTEGAPQLGLPTPLKDWPHKHYNGANRRFNQKYLQRKMIATEFLNE